MFDQITPFVIAVAASPLVYVVLFGLCLVDGFFPPVPSESALVAIAAVAATCGQPLMMAGVLVSAALGAIAGDSTAYCIGRRIGLDHLADSRRPQLVRAFTFAQQQMRRRSTSLILVGRYIPVGRVAVNMTAGATRLPYRRFIGVSSLAGFLWSATSIGIALATSSFLHDPVVAAIVSILAAAVLGVTIERVLSLVTRNRTREPLAIGAVLRGGPGLPAAETVSPVS